MAAVGVTPVVAMIDGTILQGYKSGIIDSSWCQKERSKVNHAVLIVGYDSESFIVKNFWGPAWGENGYFRIRINVDDNGTLGPCGLLTDAKYPVI